MGRGPLIDLDFARTSGYTMRLQPFPEEPIGTAKG